MPLIITHGWPGSIVEFHKVIEPLTDPTAHGGDAADAFHVVCPSLPGFGFSAKPTTTGWGVDRIAAAWAELDGSPRLRALRRAGRRLGLGGDHRDRRAGRRSTAPASTSRSPWRRGPRSRGEPTPEEARALKGIKHYADWDSGYSKQQSTRPQTLGYGLTDSPAGQAAWILEKFWAWTDCDGHPENILARDELLDNVMLYWVTAHRRVVGPALLGELRSRAPHHPQVNVPTGVAVFPQEIVPPVRRWMEGRFHQHPSLERNAQGRPLRRLRAARAVRR